MALEKLEKQSGNRAAETAGALVCRSVVFENDRLGKSEGKDEIRDKWRKYCQATIPVGRDLKLGRDELTHYYYAQAMFTSVGDAWKSYRTATFDHLKSSQNKDGSWPCRRYWRGTGLFHRCLVYRAPSGEEKPSGDANSPNCD